MFFWHDCIIYNLDVRFTKLNAIEPLGLLQKVKSTYTFCVDVVLTDEVLSVM